LSYEAMNAVTAAAAQAIQTNRVVLVRLVALGPRETNAELWRRRLYAVKDELVRLGVPASRIRAEGTGPYLLTIRPNQPAAASARSGRRAGYTTDSIPDPMSQD
jgi:outer membrane protein OmpA-like peptidoglycan-associated protein